MGPVDCCDTPEIVDMIRLASTPTGVCFGIAIVSVLLAAPPASAQQAPVRSIRALGNPTTRFTAPAESRP